MALKNYEYGDPAKVVEIKEQQVARRSCSGCTHWSILWGIAVCKKHDGRAGKEVFVCSDFDKKHYSGRK